MSVIDPTYLRNIYDSLLSNTLHKDNASALPLGLEGIYEEYLPTASCIKERQKFLDFFSAWALLKKEVSAAFVSQVLGWTVEHVMDYISKYSKWFNAPLTGKYTLYHERLRSFVLQKISHAKFTDCNEDVINLGKEALRKRSYDELEQYALEYQSTHMLIQAMETGSLDLLKELAYNTAHWTRQIEISKGFEWSKCMLNDVMLCASKFEEDEAVECALNIVDLYHMEQNDATRIVELVAKNDVEAALQRIESFGGNDKKGLRRKFVLYMLCLMELTLLKSTDNLLRKDAIDKLLKHLDDNLPLDHSVLVWDDFFSSFLMYQMASSWAALDLNYLVVYKRTDYRQKEWLREIGQINDIQLEVLRTYVRGISDDFRKCSTMKDISAILGKQGKVEEAASAMQEALTCARGISDESDKSSMLKEISTELAKQGEVEGAALAMQEALTCARGISDQSDKSTVLKDISTELAKQGNIEEAFNCVSGISNESLKSSALKDISVVLGKQGKVEEAALVLQEALTCAWGIIDESSKSRSLATISTELAKQGKVEEGSSAMQEALTCSKRIINDLEKYEVLTDISTEMAKLGKIDEALTCVNGISEEYFMSCALKDISTELAKQGKIDEALTCASAISDVDVGSMALRYITTEMAKLGKIDEAHTCAKDISDEWDKNSSWVSISTELAKQGKIDEALTCSKRIINDLGKYEVLAAISTELAKQGKVEEITSAMKEVLTYEMRFNHDGVTNGWLNDISTELAKQGKNEEALNCAWGISDESQKSSALKDISTELVKQGKIEEALNCVSGISDDYWKVSSLESISNELAKQGKIEEALNCVSNISDDHKQSTILMDICTELAKQGKVEVALNCVSGISDESAKISALKDISTALTKQGKIDEAASVMQEALNCARWISDESAKISALKDISTALAKQCKPEEAALAIQEALTCASGISDEFWKNIALNDISTELVEQGKVDQALNCVRWISDESDRISALKDISIELAKQDNWSFAETIGWDILQTDERHDCWQSIAKVTFEKMGWHLALQFSRNLQTPEAKKHYIRSLSDLLTPIECRSDLFLIALGYLLEDPSSLENLLRLYALHSLFFEKVPTINLERLNRTLNIQWAIDIKRKQIYNCNHENKKSN